jgi:hypothetical protein
MRDHALPQDVTGYKFHIIGNMTLKQFAEVAAGCVVGFFIYQTNLPVFLKWPAILMAAGAGAFMAFIPFEERPFDHWVVAFFQALYRPTQFYWKRKPKIPDAFLYKSDEVNMHMAADVDLTPARRQRVKEFLHSVKDSSDVGDQYDQYENQKVVELMGFFTSNSGSKIGEMSATMVVELPQPVGLTNNAVTQVSLPTQTVQSVDSIQTSEPAPNIDVQFSESQQTDQNTGYADTADAALGQYDSYAPRVSLSTSTPKTQAVPAATYQQPLAIPQSGRVAVSHNMGGAAISDSPELDELSRLQQDQDNQSYVGEVDSVGATSPVVTEATTQNSNLPFPSKPTEPNKVVGMALDKNNNPLTGVIVEFLTADGSSARAVKTNLLGQFFVSTPLSNGVYTVLGEQDGLQFAPTQLTVNGSILDPIEVRCLS